MRCATIHGDMGFGDLDAAEPRRRRGMRGGVPRKDLPSALPTPPAHPYSRLVEQEEKEGTPFEPGHTPVTIISPPSEMRRPRRFREKSPDVFETEAGSKYLPLPEELPPPESEEDLPDVDSPEEDTADAPVRRTVSEKEVVKLALSEKAKKPEGRARGMELSSRSSFRPSPPEEQLLGMPKLALSGLGDGEEASIFGILLVLGGIIAIGGVVYYIKHRA